MSQTQTAQIQTARAQTKRAIALVLILAGALALAACRNGDDPQPETTPVPAVATPAPTQSAADQATAAQTIAAALPAEMEVLSAAEAGAMPTLDGLFIDVAPIGLDYGAFTMPTVNAATGITIAPIRPPSYQVNLSLNPTVRMPAQPAPAPTPGATPPPGWTGPTPPPGWEGTPPPGFGP